MTGEKRERIEQSADLRLQSQIGEEERFWDRMRRMARENKTAVISFILIVLMILAAILAPVLTMMTIQFSSLLSGAVITETVFSINGIGRLMVQAISGRDIPLLQATSLLATSVVILGSFLADCLYSVLDPRIRKEG